MHLFFNAEAQSRKVTQRIFPMKIFMILIFVFATGLAGAWDVEHDEVAQLTGEFLPAEVKATFDFKDFGILLANCHYPDMTEWGEKGGPRRFRTLQNVEVCRKMSVVFAGATHPLKRNPNIDGFCKPYAPFTVREAEGIEPIAWLENGAAHLRLDAFGARVLLHCL